MMALGGKVVVVTGASRGIGRALAGAYARRGATVALLARDEAALQKVEDELVRDGVRCSAFRCDITRDADCAAAIDGVRARFGAVDVLVSNAGVTLLSRVETLPLDALREVLDVNLLGPLRLMQLVLPEMLARGSGQLVVVSSVAAARALPGLGGYAATKAALHSIVDALRAEIDGRGVDVLEVAPGKTTTDILGRARGPGGERRPLDRWQPSMTAEFVAERVARASEHGTRRLTLGLGARLIALAERVSPALTDRLAARAMSRK